jgi:hypothetical protein
MPYANYFADKADRCRELLSRAKDSQVREQLRLWANEFDAMAAAFDAQPAAPRAEEKPERAPVFHLASRR